MKNRTIKIWLYMGVFFTTLGLGVPPSIAGPDTLQNPGSTPMAQKPAGETGQSDPDTPEGQDDEPGPLSPADDDEKPKPIASYTFKDKKPIVIEEKMIIITLENGKEVVYEIYAIKPLPKPKGGEITDILAYPHPPLYSKEKKLPGPILVVIKDGTAPNVAGEAVAKPPKPGSRPALLVGGKPVSVTEVSNSGYPNSKGEVTITLR